MEDCFNILVLDFERVELLFRGLINKVGGATGFVRFLFFETGSNDSTISEVKNKNSC